MNVSFDDYSELTWKFRRKSAWGIWREKVKVCRTLYESKERPIIVKITRKSERYFSQPLFVTKWIYMCQPCRVCKREIERTYVVWTRKAITFESTAALDLCATRSSRRVATFLDSWGPGQPTKLSLSLFLSCWWKISKTIVRSLRLYFFFFPSE